MNKETNLDFSLDWINKHRSSYSVEVIEYMMKGVKEGQFFIDNNHMINQSSEFTKGLLPILTKDPRYTPMDVFLSQKKVTYDKNGNRIINISATLK